MGEMMIFWLVLLIVCIVIELPTMGLTTIWFAGGALVAILAALLHVPVFLQVILFLLVSLLLLFFTRPIAVKYFNKDRVKTNVESMVGRPLLPVRYLTCRLPGKLQWEGRNGVLEAVMIRCGYRREVW